jgi:hypothetical protein
VTQRALPSGAIRRRAVFGLFDADGWTWAGLRALFWFLVIVFLLGYVPNTIYYFTVSPTVQVGYNFLSIVNWCPAENRDLPCPAPAGALLPWQPSPAEIALPAGRAGAGVFQSGTHLYLIGGETAEGVTDQVLVTEAGVDDEGQPDGNLAAWVEGPALPEPRSNAAVGVYVGIPYVIGGLDASGQPTDTVFKGQVTDGFLTGWERADGSDAEDLTLPRTLSDAAVVTGTSGFALVGGRDASGAPVTDAIVAWVPTDPPGTTLQPWQPLEGLALPEPRAGAVAARVADFIYVVGGEGPDGPTDSVFRLQLPDTEPVLDETGRPLGWAVATDDSSTLPTPVSGAAGFTGNGAIYVIGGIGSDGSPLASTYWVVPDTSTGDFAHGWQELPQTDLSYPVASAPIAGVGSTAFVFGGRGEDGLVASTMRAGLSPRPPFYQLGIAGATLPGLAIEGEVGQQLGYINAMGVGMTNFVILVLIGLAYSHQAATRRIISRLSGGRLKVPVEDEYRA